MPVQTPVRLSSTTGRWIVLACVWGSALATIDSTVVNMALPTIGRQLDVGFGALQWTVTGYALTLAALTLLGGALGDRFGRRRIFVIGVVWFAAASLLCAAAPDMTWLIVARALQGVGGALVTPASLAIIEASFAEQDRGGAIGAWSGQSGAASAIAPFIGGWLLSLGSWRWVFLINPLLAVAVAAIAVRHIPETRDDDAGGRIDVAGSLLGVVGLGGITAAAIAASDHGFTSAGVLMPLGAGVVALSTFVFVERRIPHPTMPPSLFRSRQFSATNAVTFLLYAANAGAALLLVIELQTVSGFSPFLSGVALLPITVVMLLLAARFGALAQHIGARGPMAIGPCISAAGLILMTRLSAHSSYVSDVLPAVSVFGFGLAVCVAPLTATVLAAVPATHAGIASGVNNAVARAAGLIAIAVLPALTGLTGDTYQDPARFLPPFRDAIWICAALQLAGGALAALTITDHEQRPELAAVPPTCVSLAGHPLTAPVRRRNASQMVFVPQPADAGVGDLPPAAVDRQ